jgi:tetratricopeptide (TPR) repeat protein
VIGRPTAGSGYVSGGTTGNDTTLANAAYHPLARPWGHYHHGWYHGNWTGWGAWPSSWSGAVDSEDDQLLVPSPATVVYTNPYYVVPPVSSARTDDYSSYEVPRELDYSLPIQALSAREEADIDEDIPKAAMKSFAEARAAFKSGRYSNALEKVDRALELLRGDRTMHELRALCLFALGKYREASGVLYALLAAGPGWDWDTMAALYPDSETYTKQLHALERYVRNNPKVGAGHFVLGYHYLVLDERGGAAAEFAAAAKLHPRDRLSASLVRALAAKPQEPDEDE